MIKIFIILGGIIAAVGLAWIWPDNDDCPVCGYYCLGKGGHGCIDKPGSSENGTN